MILSGPDEDFLGGWDEAVLRLSDEVVPAQVLLDGALHQFATDTRQGNWPVIARRGLTAFLGDWGDISRAPFFREQKKQKGMKKNIYAVAKLLFSVKKKPFAKNYVKLIFSKRVSTVRISSKSRLFKYSTHYESNRKYIFRVENLVTRIPPSLISCVP